MLDLEKPVQTRDGKKVIIYRTLVNAEHDIHGAIFFDGKLHAADWNSSGYFDPPEESGAFDLVNITERHIRYVDMYRAGHTIWFNVRKDSDCYSVGNRVASIKVEIEEGEFAEINARNLE